MSVALPMFANLQGNNDCQRQIKLLAANVAVAACVGFGIAGGVALFAKPIMANFGAGFGSGQKVLILQALAAAIATTVGVLGQFLISSGKMWFLIVLQLIWASIFLGLTWVFRASGAEGLSTAY